MLSVSKLVQKNSFPTGQYNQLLTGIILLSPDCDIDQLITNNIILHVFCFPYIRVIGRFSIRHLYLKLGNRKMKKFLQIVFYSVIGTILTSVTVSASDHTDDMFGVWASLTLQGDFKYISPESGDRFKWLVMNQARTRDDSSKGTRFSENLLFSHIN